jgi:ABC-type phosphate/phosphonate transport system substrate-binding protein
MTSKSPQMLKLIFYLSMISLLTQSHVLSAGENVKIGVLAQRGAEITLTRWNHLANYLNKAIPEYHFSIEPLEFAEVSNAVVNKAVDFLFVNSGMYVELEYHFGLRPIATVCIKRGDKGTSLFAGLIVTRADRSDIRSFQDLRGKKFIAVDRDSLGGWLMAKRELELSGINTESDFKSFSFAGTHDGVVNAVLNGVADAGTIRSDTLEQMAEDRLIDINDLRVIHGNRVHFHSDVGEADYPFPHSTDIYPEWPMAKLSDTSDTLARKVAIALLKMSEDTAAAKLAGIMGWDIARNYQSVHDLYRELRIGPYRQIENLRLSDVWQRYWPTIVMVALFLVTLCGYGCSFLGHPLRYAVYPGSLAIEVNEGKPGHNPYCDV